MDGKENHLIQGGQRAEQVGEGQAMRGARSAG